MQSSYFGSIWVVVDATRQEQSDRRWQTIDLSIAYIGQRPKTRPKRTTDLTLGGRQELSINLSFVRQTNWIYRALPNPKVLPWPNVNFTPGAKRQYFAKRVVGTQPFVRLLSHFVRPICKSISSSRNKRQSFKSANGQIVFIGRSSSKKIISAKERSHVARTRLPIHLALYFNYKYSIRWLPAGSAKH